MKALTSNRWARLGIAVVTLLFAGIIYAWSILRGPLQQTFGWSESALQFNFTVTMCLFCLGGLASGLLSKKVSPRTRMIIAAVCVFFGFFWTSRLDGSAVAWLYIAYGILAGGGIGIVYNTVIASTTAWFPDRKGLCSGAMMMGFGFSTLVLGSLAATMIDSATIGWRSTFLILAIMIGVVILLAGLLVRPPKPGELSDSILANVSAKTSAARDYTAGEMIRRPSFWLLFVFFILLSAVGSTAISFAKQCAESLGASAALSVAIVGVLSVCNGLGRLASGAAFDRMGLRNTQYLTSAVVILASALTMVAFFAHSVALGVIGLCLCGFSYGFSPTVSAAFANAFYGSKNYALNFSLLNLVLIPSSFTATLAGKLVEASGGYTSTFVLLTVFSVIGLGVNAFIREA